MAIMSMFLTQLKVFTAEAQKISFGFKGLNLV
jgi:hypothetical protein